MKNPLTPCSELYSRDAFIRYFKILTKSGYDPDEALRFIMTNCLLSALVFQEFIHNGKYRSL